MKRNVTIAGAQYTGVPSVLIPLTGSNDKAVFCEVSDTTATAEDVANGKIFYTADGTATTGTATGGKTVTPQFKVNITQSDNQTITCSGVAAKAPTLSNGVISVTPDLFTANFIVTPASGYAAGTLSETSHKFSTWGETVNISATAATAIINTVSYTIKGSTDYTDKTITVDGTTYTLTPFDTNSRTLLSFSFISDGDVSIVPKYNSSVTQASLQEDGALYKLFKNSTWTLKTVGYPVQYTFTADGSNCQIYTYPAIPFIYMPASNFSPSGLNNLRNVYQSGATIEVSFKSK